ncbi:hypothetical protein PILCRDRAFT_12969 [Piloderma croceum F 1598]|uniref:Uncharacterized protein n=1 Tax=Piloderma croceum (strain F 1598) TaxID=765440 RepID=A0A0C3AQL6_PILCF|nr:hypothetical protein PILCRDRAFT_12969 [Piloderma croceum F 1598]
MRDMESWNHLFQPSLREDNGGLHAQEYHVVQAISPFYMCFPTRPCAWFITGPGHLRRAFPSDETKLQLGIVLHLEDTSISTFLPVTDYPVNFIHLEKPIHHEEGYVIYQFTTNLLSRSHNPQSLEPPTNLIAIPEYHAHEEAAHLNYEIATLHQRVLEKVYALPPLHTWENKWCTLSCGKIEDLSWSEEVEKAELGWSEQEEQNLVTQ